MSHVHAIAVYLLVALTVGLVVPRPPRRGPDGRPRGRLLLLGVELAQGLVGFTQYFLDLPEGLVVPPPARRRADLRRRSTAVVAGRRGALEPLSR